MTHDQGTGIQKNSYRLTGRILPARRCSEAPALEASHPGGQHGEAQQNDAPIEQQHSTCFWHETSQKSQNPILSIEDFTV